jgi:hypothetical protein
MHSTPRSLSPPISANACAPGARPCLDLIGLDEYLAALSGLDITVIRR